MDSGSKITNEYPRSKANVVSKIFFLWMWKWLSNTSIRGIKIEELFINRKSDSSETLTNALEENWNTEMRNARLKKKKPKLLKALLKTFFLSLLRVGMYALLLEILLRLNYPLMIGVLISQCSSSIERNKYISGAILIGLVFVGSVVTHHVNDQVTTLMMRIRVAISSLIYRKILNLSQSSTNRTSPGHILNLLSNDVNRFDLIAIALNYIWIAPVLSILVTYYLWIEMREAAFPGVIYMFLFTVPIQGIIAKVSSFLCSKTAKQTDERVTLMAELIQGIKAIKMYAWERPFQKTITDIRNKEIKFLTRSAYIKGFFLSSMNLTDQIGLFFSILTYILLGQKMEPRVVFVGALLYNYFQVNMGLFFFLSMNLGAEILVSIRRFEEFLLLDEQKEVRSEETIDKSIEVEKVSCGWVEGVPVLKEISFRVAPGSLCFIIGNIGSGKSSLLHLILGELQPKSGFVKLGGTISYSSQEPWIFSSTARQNILFGQDFDEERYRTVVRICCLETDFKNLPLGDQTLVGDRGTMLSGGQKARINLARAVYRNADIYLLDDPLSAVDVNVGKDIFAKCVLGYLKDKTRILVTHQLQYLQWADYIIILKNGLTEIRGTYKELTAKDLNFAEIFNDDLQKKQTQNYLKENTLDKTELNLNGNEKNRAQNEFSEINKKSVFIAYLKTGANQKLLLIVCILLLLTQILSTSSVIFLSLWTQHEETKFNDPTENISTSIQNSINKEFTKYSLDSILANRMLCVVIYVSLIVLSVIISMLRSMIFLKTATLSSKRLHEKMLVSLLEVPMKFFDNNPSGRILNRFSKDLGAIDQVLPSALLAALQILLVILGIVVSVTYANYYLLFAIIALGLLFIKIGKKYFETARKVKHLEGIAKSPLYSHVNSSFNGITTIRASKAENILKIQFDQLQDVHTSAFKMTLDCQCAFGLWIELLIALFLAVLVFACILYTPDISLLGLALSQGMILTGILQYSLRQTAEVINHLTNLERVIEYTKLDKEEPIPDGKKQLAKPSFKHWPSQGQISFDRVHLRYSPENEPVLKGVSFSIRPGEKIGIVGRTGAGKSSLISALFRLVPFEGRIFIDDVDTKSVSLRDLRSSISIIPQEPVLISATIRHNLDPFCLHQDSKIWKALEEVRLKDCVDSLDFFVTEGGSNFSGGQRQLLCLARAVLSNNKILVLDEATANVDLETDSLIQKTIRRKFASNTVITVAHRINTVMDSDKIIVMEFGEIVEFEHPFVLLQDPKSHFHGLVQQTGSKLTQNLYTIAQKSYINNVVSKQI